MISLPQVLPGRNNWNIFHPRRALFQALAPKFLFSLFFPCFTPFGLISNVQKNQKKGFVFKEWNIALTFKDKGPHSFLANPFTKARTSLVVFPGKQSCWRRDRLPTPVSLGFPDGSDGKESARNVGDLGQEDPLEKVMATRSRILAWRIPWTEEPGGLQSVGSQPVEQD